MWIDRLINVFALIAGILLCGLVLLICADVCARYFRLFAMPWSLDAAEHTLYFVTFLGAPWVLLTRGHVNVELVPLMLGPRGRYLLALFAYLGSAALCIMLTWYSALFWHEAWEGGWLSDTVWGPPLWKVYLAMPIGFFVISLQYIADLLSLLKGWQPPFGIDLENPPEID